MTGQNYGRQYWAEKIRDDLSGAVGGIIQAGADLITAKSELGLGAGSKRDSWIAFLMECGLGEATASKLMTIARNQVLADFSQWEKLPVSWTSLYLLSQVPDDKLAAYLQSGEVHTRMTREDVERLIKGTGRKRGKGKPRPRIKDLLEEIEHLKTALAEAREPTLDDFHRAGLDGPAAEWRVYCGECNDFMPRDHDCPVNGATADSDASGGAEPADTSAEADDGHLGDDDVAGTEDSPLDVLRVAGLLGRLYPDELVDSIKRTLSADQIDELIKMLKAE